MTVVIPWPQLVRQVTQHFEARQAAEALQLLVREAEACAAAHRREEALQRIQLALYFDNRDPALWQCYERIAPTPRAAHWPEVDCVLYTGHPFGGLLPYPSELVHHAVGGSESVFLLMAQALAAQGLRVAAFAPFPTARLDGGVQCLPLLEFFPYQQYVGLPICIVLRFYQPFLNACRARRRIFWLQDIVAPSYRSLYQRMDAQVDEYWVLSDYQQQCYVDRCGLSAEKFRQTTNVFDTALFPTAPLPRAARRSGQLVFTSRPGRGLGVAAAVVAALRPEFPHLQLMACAYSAQRELWDDPELVPFRPLLSRIGAQVARFDKQALAQLLRESELMLYPNTSDLETSCVAAIEAMAAGLPIVTSDRGALPETVPPDGAGIVVPWTASEAVLIDRLATATRELLQDPARWERYAAAGPRRAQARHTAAVVAASWRRRLQDAGV